jgi:5-oxoprolinase (ATP-hydrolysing) subunit A
MTSIDLNCDIGEGCCNDPELLRYISSANIACGYHAGDERTMCETIRLAIESDVAIGAHPGFPDKANFGRTNMSLSTEEIKKIVIDQLASLQEICNQSGGKLNHVKPHGALYNLSANDESVATAIAEAVHSFDSDLILYGLSGSLSITAAEQVGLKTASEVFADRTYQNDGTLTSRTEPNALLQTSEDAVEHILNMVKYRRVRTVDAVMLPIQADTVCIHGDGEHAVEFAKAVHDALISNGISISSLR